MSDEKQHGGPRPGSGRKPGSRNEATLRRLEAAAELVEILAEVTGTEPFEGDAHAFMTVIYKHPKLPVELRLDAAKAAIKVEKPQLAAVEPVPEGTFVKHEDALAELMAITDDDTPGTGVPS